MFVPLAAIVITFVYYSASLRSDHYVEELNHVEDAQPRLFAEQMDSLVEPKLLPTFRQLEKENPGWQFAAFRGEELLASTVSLSEKELEVVRHIPPITADERGRGWTMRAGNGKPVWYCLTVTSVPAWPSDTRLVTFYSYEHALMLNRQAATRNFVVASVVAFVLIIAVTWYTGQLSRRICRIKQQVTRIAKGDFGQVVEVHGHDEVDDLARSVNSMATQLQQLHDAIRVSERTRLQGQLAGGVAHELRNGIHSARLSLEVFQEACRSFTLPSENMLDTAKEQLLVTETLVRRLLSIGKTQERERLQRPLAEVLQDVATMVEPICRHLEIDFALTHDHRLVHTVQDSEMLQAAIVNLCLNGVEAIGRHGELRVDTQYRDGQIEICVSDNGPGPDAALSDQLFEPFVTSKPDGIGLGLAQVRQAAETEDGTITWTRNGSWTNFVLSFPTLSIPKPTEVAVASL
ncbi:sensor histidine kinase [Thalassoroseus pseudoceratinae]|uniref:sensor histidine kinase n=1 Tax=Thalassoroseus pseudoceratinae TaxID=2713176 RepID=UPI00197FFD08|nr:HAMP domain-containing sensor histidine kinase [Thalassoroseus pseudoceratinae]